MFRRGFIAHPGPAERWRHGPPLAEADRATFYGTAGAKGYTDDPRWSQQEMAA